MRIVAYFIQPLAVVHAQVVHFKIRHFNYVISIPHFRIQYVTLIRIDAILSASAVLHCSLHQFFSLFLFRFELLICPIWILPIFFTSTLDITQEHLVFIFVFLIEMSEVLTFKMKLALSHLLHVFDLPNFLDSLTLFHLLLLLL